MLRALRWTVRQRRYRAMLAGAIVIAIGCIIAGTFEATRYVDKRRENRTLLGQARAATVLLTPSLVPVTGSASRFDGTGVLYRTVRATGTFDVGREQYVDNQSQGGRQGYVVLTPLRTTGGVLLVARGFVTETVTGARPARVPRPPTGRVEVTGRLYPGQTRSDAFGQLARNEIVSVNPAQQAARSDITVYRAFVRLGKGQPGTTGLRILPRPDLSNPSGGAGEAQLFSYIVQWYVFALLALAAPFAIARTETREAQRIYLGIDPDAVEFDELPAAREAVAAQIGGTEAGGTETGGTETGGAPAGGELVVRAGGALVRPGEPSPRWREAERLADRYGRSLGPVPANGSDLGARVLRRRPSLDEQPVRTSATVPHRATDEFHGAYNDYLWELALADGGLSVGPREPETPLTASPPPAARPMRVIDAIEPPTPDRPDADDTSPDGPRAR